MGDPKLPKDATGARNPFEPGFVPAPARPAATILLLRRGGKHADRELEVLLVKRSESARFMPGVWVFPGGSVDAGDKAEREQLPAPPSGATRDTRAARGMADPDADERAHRAAAIRELSEEAGIQLEPSAELILWSRWITPEPVPIRFDTRFYLALAPAHSPPEPDGSEIVDAAWMNPRRALESGASGEIELVFPTIKQLESLAPYATAAEAMEAARTTVVEPIMPNVVPDSSEPGWRMLMPGDEGYVPPVV